MAKENPMGGIGKDITDLEQRARFIKDNADAVVNKSYMKQFTQEQLQQNKEELAAVCLELESISNEKKDAMKDFNDRMKPLAEKQTHILESIRNKAELVSEVCYKFVNQEERMTYFYNSVGDCVEARGCTADEMQTNIHMTLRATGTEGN